MKMTTPDALKEGVPRTMWRRILAAAPAVMAVLTALLAGLAFSEMTQARYDRSLAAQEQSTAGDQWSYFQAKRLREAGLRRCVGASATAHRKGIPCVPDSPK